MGERAGVRGINCAIPSLKYGRLMLWFAVMSSEYENPALMTPNCLLHFCSEL